MAQLFRVVNLSESGDSRLFSFLIPLELVVKQTALELASRTFTFAGNNWRIVVSVCADGTHLSPYLQLVGASARLSCCLDYSFELVNQESYTRNEKFSEVKCLFSNGSARHGSRTFIVLEDLWRRNGFVHSTAQIALQLTMKNATTTIDAGLLIMPNNGLEPDCRRYDSDGFTFGDESWQLVFCPNMEDDSNYDSERRRYHQHQPSHLLQLHRTSKSAMMQNIHYLISLGTSGCSNMALPGQKEVIDYSGNSEGIYFIGDYFRYCRRDEDCGDGYLLPVQITFHSVIAVSHVQLKPPENTVVTCATVTDPVKRAWTVTLEKSLLDLISVQLSPTDWTSLPAAHCWYVCWTCKLLPVTEPRTKPKPSAPISEALFTRLSWEKYSKTTTKLTLEEVMSDNWLSGTEGKLTLQIQWIANYTLVHSTYTSLDHTFRRHLSQMCREITALQAENNSLEKELHNCQQMVAQKDNMQIQRHGLQHPPKDIQSGNPLPLAQAHTLPHQFGVYENAHRQPIDNGSAHDYDVNLYGTGAVDIQPQCGDEDDGQLEQAGFSEPTLVEYYTNDGHIGSGGDEEDEVGEYYEEEAAEEQEYDYYYGDQDFQSRYDNNIQS